MDSRNGSAGTAFRTAAPPFQQTNPLYSYGFNNTLIEASTQSEDRKTVTLVDYDIHRTVSVVGRRTLLSLARTMFWRIPALQAAILEQANLAVSTFTPRFCGANKAWGEIALEKLNGFHKVMDLAGWPYDYDTYNELQVVSSIVDGDTFTILTEDGNHNPRIQTIPSHRVGSRYQTGGAAQVRYDGNQLYIDDILVDANLPFSFTNKTEWTAPIIDGVIVDGQMRPIAYRVYDDPVVSAKYVDYSATSCFPSFIPMFPTQVRGFSLLASSIFDWQDVREYRRFEMLAQKTFASKTIVETNESGDEDSAKAIISSAAQFDSAGNKKTPDLLKIDGGAYHIFKAGTNSKLEAFNYSGRPGMEAQAFMDSTVRDAMRGTEWDTFFSLDPKTVGGAPMRVIVDKINRVLKKRRRLVGKSTLRVDIYAIAKYIKNGDLPFDPDWFKWCHQGPPDITSDRRYDAQTDQMEYELGWSTLADIEARRNGDWQLKRQQREIEVRDLLTRAKGLAAEFGISIQEAMTQMSMLGQASFTRTAQEPSGDTEAPQSEPKGAQ